MRIRSLTDLAGLVLISVAVACSPPPVRRSAFVPDAYLPSQIGAPMDRGEVRITGEVGGAPAGNPQEAITPIEGAYGDAPGIYIPRLHVGGSFGSVVTFGSSGADKLELGGQLHYSDYRWARANVTHVPAFPDSMSKDLFRGGTGLRYTHEFQSHLFLGVGTQFDLAVINEAIYVSGKFLQADQEVFLLPAVYSHFGYRLSEALAVYGMSGLQLNVRNRGFSYDTAAAGDSTLTPFVVANFGGGIEGRVGPLVANLAVAWPVAADSYIRLGPTVTAQLGFAFGSSRPSAAPESALAAR